MKTRVRPEIATLTYSHFDRDSRTVNCAVTGSELKKRARQIESELKKRERQIESEVRRGTRRREEASESQRKAKRFRGRLK